jgi:hypothetical protein
MVNVSNDIDFVGFSATHFIANADALINEQSTQKNRCTFSLTVTNEAKQVHSSLPWVIFSSLKLS